MRRLILLISILSLMLLNSTCDGVLMESSLSEEEPNGNRQTAQSINVNGTVISAFIGPEKDHDFYKFTGEVGYGYLVKLTWVSGNGLNLWGAWANERSLLGKFNVNVEREDEAITIDFHTKGKVCYLVVSDSSAANTGQYTISVTKGAFGTSSVDFKD